MSKLISKIVVPDSNEATGYSLYNVKDSGAIHSSDVGVAGGVASLDNAGKVPSSQLPSYVDDVVEGYYHENKFYTTYTPGQEEEDPGTYSGEITAETGKIYVDIPTNQSYRWSGSAYIVISSPYVLPTASANTLGGVKVGDNLSIDQNGVLSAADATNEVLIGGETPSSDSDVEIFIDTTEDAIAEVYTKQQQDGKFVVIKDLNAAPTESTLTYTENGTVKNFKQGDEVRVPDAEAENGYTFYKLYELTTSGNTTTAVWDKLGAGGSTPSLTETVIISLAQQNGADADLIGATVTVSDVDTSQVTHSTTWQGTDISIEVESGVTYTIIVGSVTGYMTPSSQTYEALPTYTREVEFLYNNNLGVYIEATDGTLLTSSRWSSSGKSANSIVVLSSACNFRIALTETKLPIHSNFSDPIDSYLSPINSVALAKADYNGASNTTKIIQFNAAYGTNTTSYAAPYCNAFNFPNNQASAYLPSCGQLGIINQNITEVNNCLTACGGTLLTVNGSMCYRTSTVGYNANSPDMKVAYIFFFVVNEPYGAYIRDSYFVRPCADYE